MDSATIILLILLAAVAAVTLMVFSGARRRDAMRAMEQVPDEPADETEMALMVAAQGQVSSTALERVTGEDRSKSLVAGGDATPAVVVPDEETLGVSRRQVLNRGIVGSMVMGITAFSGASLAFLWPTLSGGFGSKITVGRKDELLADIARSGEPIYVGAGRFYLNPYPVDAVPAAQQVTAYGALIGGFEEGLTAVYQKCPHLGCRVPWCNPSQWFECPCHGSQYNRVGEHKAGPAPRGMDHFPVSVDAGRVVVDTGTVIPGPPRGTNTTGQEAEGPHCIGSTEGGH